MKKTIKIFHKLLFFFLVIVFVMVIFLPCQKVSGLSLKINIQANANFILKNNKLKESIDKEKNTFEFSYKGKKFLFSESEFDLKLSENQKKIRKKENIFNDIENLKNMGFSEEEAITYIFPETIKILEKLKKAVEIEPEQDEIFAYKNSCEIIIEKGKEGLFLNKTKFFKDFYNCLKNKNKKISFEIETKSFELPEISKSEYTEKSCFSTNFESSSESRKNNIRVALSMFDGLVLEDGEVLSFNQTTGVRNEKAGYMPAKIISGGTFVEGFGGGVCQVSTTLYNACLLSGLEILEVHNHSLPVSYIEPSFDAMVNIGSSDLVIRNNSGGRLIFTTSSKGDICKVKIFGKTNEFKITRFSEKTKIIPAEKEEVITDSKRAEEFGVMLGEEKRISYAKDGFFSNGYLNYYDKQGNLVKTKKIRSNTYNPTKGIVVKNIN